MTVIRRTRAMVASSLLALALCPVPAAAQEIAVRTTTLANGMKVIVHEDHSIPSVALFVFYRIGSRNEHPGTTGLSHFFEHMMFNGAKTYGPKQLDVVMEAAGARNNAYTDYDVTVYQDWFPPSALDLILAIEADRIEHLAFDPKMVESERGVVASERRTSVEANNYAILDEQLWAAAFTAHPYQWPVIGWMSDIQSWTMDDLKHHFRMGYSPSNATLVVAGDVTYDDFVRKAREKLEPIPSHDPPPPVVTQEPAQPGERRIQVIKTAQLPILQVGYHVPESRSSGFYTAQVLRNVLFFGQSSRMYRRLVDGDQLAVEVDSAMGLSLDPTLFTITVQPREGVEPAAVENALFEEIERVKEGGVTADELQKAKNALLAAFYENMKTISGKAQALGSYEVYFGDHRKLFDAAAEYGKVTSDDVVAFARKHLNARNRSVATLLPEPAAPAEARDASREPVADPPTTEEPAPWPVPRTRTDPGTKTQATEDGKPPQARPTPTPSNPREQGGTR